MGDKKTPTSREKIVLEYLSGGVTYRQLEEKYGVDHSAIQRWVMIAKGKPRNREEQQPSLKSTSQGPSIKPVMEIPVPLVMPLPEPLETDLARQLREAKLKISLLEEIISIAQAEHGLVLPKKSNTKRSTLSGNNKK